MQFTTLTIVSAVLLSLESPIGMVLADPSDNMKGLLSAFNGFYTNRAQLAQDDLNENLDDEHDLITATWRPGYTDVFPNKEVIYLEQVVNNEINRMKLLVLTEDKFGIITADPYNVIQPKDYSVNQFDSVDLSNITIDPKKPEPFCKITFTKLEGNTYVGMYPDCNTHDRWLNPRYGFAITCNTFSAIMCSPANKEAMSKVPYIFYKKRRYTLPDKLIGDAAKTCSAS